MTQAVEAVVLQGEGGSLGEAYYMEYCKETNKVSYWLFGRWEES
jgi:hypothetical protein